MGRRQWAWVTHAVAADRLAQWLTQVLREIRGAVREREVNVVTEQRKSTPVPSPRDEGEPELGAIALGSEDLVQPMAPGLGRPAEGQDPRLSRPADQVRIAVDVVRERGHRAFGKQCARQGSRSCSRIPARAARRSAAMQTT